MLTKYVNHSISNFDLSIWFENNIFRVIFSLITIIIAITLVLIMKVISFRVKKVNNKRGYTVVKLVESILKYLIIIITIFVLLGIWGINVTTALIGVGIVVLIVGLGAQELIKDLIAGIGIVMDNQYDVDEVVEINNFKGKVIEIRLRTTKLVNNKGEIRIVRNGSIQSVSNFSRTFSVATTFINVSINENIDKVMDLLKENLPTLKESYPQIIEGPLVVGVEALTEEVVKIKVTAKTNPEEHYSVQRGLLKYVKELFDENDIKISDQHNGNNKGGKNEL